MTDENKDSSTELSPASKLSLHDLFLVINIGVYPCASVVLSGHPFRVRIMGGSATGGYASLTARLLSNHPVGVSEWRREKKTRGSRVSTVHLFVKQ